MIDIVLDTLTLDMGHGRLELNGTSDFDHVLEAGDGELVTVVENQVLGRSWIAKSAFKIESDSLLFKSLGLALRRASRGILSTRSVLGQSPFLLD